MAFIENIKDVLLEILELPEYAWSEYIIKKQRESGWSKDVFLKALEAEYYEYNYEYLKERGMILEKDVFIDDNSIGKRIEDVSNGKTKKIKLGFGKSTELINDALLKKWLKAIKDASSFGEPKHIYSDLEILHIAERALDFILSEFELQAGIKKIDIFFRSAPKGFTGKTESGAEQFLLHDYYINGPEPMYDFFAFKQSLRSLFLSSKNTENLKIVLISLLDKAKRIIKIWNERLQAIDSAKGNYVKTRRLIQYDDIKMVDFTIIQNEKFLEFSKFSKPFTNFHFVKYAFEVGNLIATEFVESDEKVKSIKEVKPSVASYALLHVYWSKYDQTKAITKTNKEAFATRYGISENTLLAEYKKYIDKNARQGLSAEKERRNAINPYIKRFEDAAFMLKDLHPEAYNDIINDLNFIKDRYEISSL